MCACAVGANSGQKVTKRLKTPTATSEELGAKTWCWQKKAGYCASPCTQHHKGVGKPPQPPLWPTPRHTPTLTAYKEPT